MRSLRLPILLALAALVAAIGAFSAPPAAAATKPCWRVLINDWYDGRIDGTYPARCYREAIKNLPEDVRAYSEAREDIERALLAAIREGEQSGDPLDPGDPVVPPPATETSTEPDPDDAEAVPGGSDDDDGGVLGGTFRPSNADSVPIPLLVLAGLALLLLAAAAAGFVARRIQARRMRVSPLPRGPESP